MSASRWTRRAGVTLAFCAPLWAGLAHADSPIVKIEGDLPADLRDKIEINLEQIEEKARSRAQAKRRIERTVRAVRSVLHSEGYYDADIQGRIDEAAPKDDPGKTPPLQPVIVVDPGVRYVIGTAEVDFVGGIYDQELEARAQLDLPPGEPAIAAEVVAAGLRVTNYLEQHGYPEARITDREVVLDHEQDQLDVTYPVEAGDKTRFGQLLLDKGDAKVAPRFLRWVKPFEEGDVFDERLTDELTSRVVSTGVFQQAAVTLSEDKVENADGTVTRNVLLNIDQGPKNTVSGSIGYSTTEGSGVEVIYERRNFVGYAQTLTLRAVARTNEIGGGIDYFVPYFFDVDRSLTLNAEAIDESNEAFDGQRITARALVSEALSEHLRVGYGVGVEASKFDQNGIERTAYVADAVGSATYDRRNNRLDPTKGFILAAEATPSYNFGDNQAFFTRANVSGAAYKAVHPEFVLAGRLAAGSVFGTDLDNIPFNRRFYAGGGGSVRGFEFRSIGPRDINGDGIGGRSVVEGSAEVRWRSRTLFNGNLGGAVFVDAASVAIPEIADFREIRYGAGVGVRYYTQFAPMRADIAIPLNPRDGDPAVQVYISIGQAF